MYLPISICYYFFCVKIFCKVSILLNKLFNVVRMTIGAASKFAIKLIYLPYFMLFVLLLISLNVPFENFEVC